MKNPLELEGLILTGLQLLAQEEKNKQEKIRIQKAEEKEKWISLYGIAQRALPKEISRFLARPREIQNEQQCVIFSISNYYDWLLKVGILVSINVLFGDDGRPCKYVVPLAVTELSGFNKINSRDFSGDHMLERALAYAVKQTIKLQELENERKRQEKEYEEREAMAAQEPKYENVDGSEPLPDLVVLAGMRHMIQEELKKAGVLS